VTADAGARSASLSWLALWRARPALYSRPAWLALLLLDPLPWPWGERALAAVFLAKAFLRPRRLRRALTWAGAQPGARGRWRLALACHAHHGRVLARQALLGLRSPEALRRHLVIEGEEHLAAASSGGLLLGFHMGAPAVAIALRTAGYPVTWMGGWRASRRWLSPPWQGTHRSDDIAAQPASDRPRWGGLLFQARERLAAGAILYTTAEGASGRLVVRVPLPGGAVDLRGGWFALRRQSSVPVIPVLSRFEGLTQVITVHPPLPPPHPDARRDLAVCTGVIGHLLEEYVRGFPEQCYVLTFYTTSSAAPAAAPIAQRAR
jgi:lauroyl/myristoyl acyltransferase